MKEKETKQIVQQSLMKTSEDFTDELMHRIELEKAAIPVKVNWWLPILGCCGVAILGFLLFQLSWENALMDASQKRLFQALLSLILIFSCYRFYDLRRNVNFQNQLKSGNFRSN